VVPKKEERYNATTDASKSSSALKSHTKWNKWLTRCLKNKDLEELVKVKYGIQLGMDDLVKTKMNTPFVNEMFCRLIKSIENTAWSIIKKRNPMPNDIVGNTETNNKTLEAKRKRDLEFNNFLMRTSW